MSVENGATGEVPQEAFRDEVVHTSIETYKGNTWAIRTDASGNRIGTELVASPFPGVMERYQAEQQEPFGGMEDPRLARAAAALSHTAGVNGAVVEMPQQAPTPLEDIAQAVA